MSNSSQHRLIQLQAKSIKPEMNLESVSFWQHDLQFSTEQNQPDEQIPQKMFCKTLNNKLRSIVSSGKLLNWSNVNWMLVIINSSRLYFNWIINFNRTHMKPIPFLVYRIISGPVVFFLSVPEFMFLLVSGDHPPQHWSLSVSVSPCQILLQFCLVVLVSCQVSKASLALPVSFMFSSCSCRFPSININQRLGSQKQWEQQHLVGKPSC